MPLLDYQREDVEAADRFRWNCWARQTGKSFTKSLRRILRGLARRRNQIFLSAGERQSRELMEKARQHCHALRIAAEFHGDRSFDDYDEKQLEIRLPGGVRVIGLPANPQTARGFTGDVLLDEFAMHVADRDIWAAMFPTLLRGDGELDVASTPKGCSNVFHDLRDNARFATSVITLPDAVARGLNVDIDEIRAAMGDDELFRQEFLCEFLDESTAFLSHEQIAACADPNLVAFDRVAPLASESRDLFVGVDVGRLRDLTVIWVFARGLDHTGASPTDRSTSTSPDHHITPSPYPATVLHAVAVVELSLAPFREQSDVLCELLSLPAVRRCCIDAGGLGMQLAEQLVERFGTLRVEPVVFTAALKSHLAVALRVAVENRAVRIPADDRIRNDWHGVERAVSESGHFRLIAPRREGSHSDRFWAAALALRAAAGNTPAFAPEMLTVKPIQFATTGTW